MSSRRVTPGQFHRGLRVVPHRVVRGRCRLVDSVGRLAGAADRAPDVDLRPGGVTVRLAVDSPDGLPAGNLELARWISAAARELGVDVWVAEVEVAG